MKIIEINRNYIWLHFAVFIEYLRIVFAKDGSWTEWTDWKSCSVSCGRGQQTRYRACDPPPSIGGKWCEGSYRDVRDCETKVLCPINGKWSEWGMWTECSVSCGEGTRHRYRSCNNPEPREGGLPCDGPSQESQFCFVQKDCPRDGKWSPWSAWSKCSVTCGKGGTIQRYRSCNNPPPAADGQPCKGSPSNVQPCEAPVKCPVNGQWSEWAEWTQCSVTCGNGEQRRWRTCDDPPPQYGGKDCDRIHGGEMQILSCNGSILQCPVDGRWSEWSEWGDCINPNCIISGHISYQTRERSCNSPTPAHKGIMCQGSFLDAGVCLQPTNCKVDGGWSEWSEWSCTKNVAIRERICNNPLPSNGGLLCKGSTTDFYGSDQDEYRDKCRDFITDDEDFQGSGSGMQSDEQLPIDPRVLNG